jgi:hypothetical protein
MADLAGHADISLHRQRPPTGGADRIGHPGRCRLVALVVHCDRPAVPRRAQRRGGANAAPGAGNDQNLAHTLSIVFSDTYHRNI